jgi:integrase
MSSILRRGLTFYARLNIPEARWADVGRAMGAVGGVKRELVKTLQTTNRREAEQRRDAAIGAMRASVDEALRRAKLRPLTDWTANWMPRAVQRRQERLDGADVVVFVDRRPEGSVPVTGADLSQDAIEADAEAVEARQGEEAGAAFLKVALGTSMSVAEGARQWLETEQGRVKVQTINGHRAALAKLGAYMAEHHGLPSLEGVGLADITRRIAGEFIAERLGSSEPATVLREASAYNGLWRWAVRRGYAEMNPFDDQMAGTKARRATDAPPERGYTPDELGILLRAGAAELAPGKGALAATFWDGMRLALLTGGRASEVFGLTVGDVIEGGTAVVFGGGPGGGKTDAASRIVPLHPIAARVVRDRLATLPDRSPGAPLWPEVPEEGADGRRSKTIGTRWPAIRRRLLGLSDEVDFHSFRRSFLTAAETAMHAGGRVNAPLIGLLGGHKREGLAFNLYSDWSRLGRPEMRGKLAVQLATLAEAVVDIVDLGLPDIVLKALAETAANRPAVVRVAPAFRRKKAGNLAGRVQ